MKRTLPVLILIALLVSVAPVACGPSGGAVNLTRDPRISDWWPEWSPDGSKILFQSGKPVYSEDMMVGYDESGIYVMDADGKNRTALLLFTPPPGGTYVSPPGGRYVGPPGGRYMSWSPDGTHLLLGGLGDIHTFDLETKEVNNLGVLADASVYDVFERPAYSPCRTRIVFARIGAGIWVVDADGSNLTLLSPEGADDNEPAWSPDGTKLAFSSQNAIWVMDADGTNRQLLTKSGYQPDWSPDGQRIVFSSPRGYLHVMDADGSNVTGLTDPKLGAAMHPRWSPDGTRIVFHVYPDDQDVTHIYVIDAPSPAHDG